MAIVYRIIKGSPLTFEEGDGNIQHLDEHKIEKPVAPTTGLFLKWNGTMWVDSAVTSTDVGLGNVNNTSDLNKPISTATQAALNGKEPAADNTPSNGDVLTFSGGVRTWSPGGGGGSNFASANLTFTDNRTHNIDNHRLTFDKVDRFVVTSFTTNGRVMSMTSNHFFGAGDPQGLANKTALTIDDQNKTISLNAEDLIELSDPLGNQGATWDFSHRYFIIGDASSTGNNSKIEIDDNGQVINIRSGGDFFAGDEGGYSNGAYVFVSNANSEFGIVNAALKLDAAHTPDDHQDYTLNIDAGTGQVGMEFNPFQKIKVTGTTNGTDITSAIYTLPNRASIRIEVAYVGRNGANKCISGVKYATYYGQSGAQLVGAVTDVVSEQLYNVDPAAYCDLIVSGSDISVKFSTDAADGTIDWDIIVTFRVF